MFILFIIIFFLIPILLIIFFATKNSFKSSKKVAIPLIIISVLAWFLNLYCAFHETEKNIALPYSESKLSISEARPTLKNDGVLIPKEFDSGKIIKRSYFIDANSISYKGKIFSSEKLTLNPTQFSTNSTVVEDCDKLTEHLKKELPYCNGKNHPNLLILETTSHSFIAVEVTYSGTIMYIDS